MNRKAYIAPLISHFTLEIATLLAGSQPPYADAKSGLEFDSEFDESQDSNPWENVGQHGSLWD